METGRLQFEIHYLNKINFCEDKFISNKFFRDFAETNFSEWSNK